MEDLLLAMSDALIRCQSSDGSLFCACCQCWHTRAGEAVYPFAVAHRRSQQPAYLEAAKVLGDWLVAQQQPGGYWPETPSKLPATTVFQLMALAAAYPLLRDHLSWAEQAQWRTGIQRAARWVANTISEQSTYINYCAAGAAALMLADRALDQHELHERARLLARQVLHRIDRRGILWGEGPYYLRSLGRVTGRGGVDVAYNLEMSLGALALYAVLARDDECRRNVARALRAHLCFLYPDGSIDDSWGTRSYKWTVYGSQTAHGLPMALALLADQDSSLDAASALSLSCMRRCMSNGLLGYGPHSWWDLSFQPCIYPTFTRATALAFALEHASQAGMEQRSTAWDDPAGITIFPALHVCVVRTSGLKATVSAYRPGYLRWNTVAQAANVLRRAYRRRRDGTIVFDRVPVTPTGGCLSYLWVQGYGLVQASSQAAYWPVEPMHMPEIANIDTLTPHVRAWQGDHWCSNLYERQAHIQPEDAAPLARVTCSGQLKDPQAHPSGLRFEHSFEFDHDAVTKTIIVRGSSLPDRIEIVEPIIRQPAQRVEAWDTGVSLASGSQACLVELLDGPASLVHGEAMSRCWSLFPHLYGYPVKLVVEKPDALPVTVTYRVAAGRRPHQAGGTLVVSCR